MATRPQESPNTSANDRHRHTGDGQRVLAHAQASRDVVQEFVPLAESLEWELGQQYLRERGNKAFISDASPVPFVINNDGSLSRNAAEVFFVSLVEADKGGTLEDDLFGLAARFARTSTVLRTFVPLFHGCCAKNL